MDKFAKLFSKARVVSSCLFHPEPEPEAVTNPCVPNPCGANADCLAHNDDVAVCQCRPGTQGDPNLGCKYECIVNSECPTEQACVNRRCTDPCPGTCGIEALCSVVAHNPICRCPPGYTGDPVYRCTISKHGTLRVCYSPFVACIHTIRFDLDAA